MRSLITLATTSVALLLAAPALAGGLTFYVDDCAGTGTGTQNDPFCSIQQGYDAAGDGDIVVVLAGTYQECVVAADLISQKGVTIVADAFDPQDPEVTAALTTIDGTGLCTFPDATVNIGGTGSRLEGFRITGGEASGVFGVGTVTITNNLIEGNTSTLGGGIYIYPGSCVYGNTTIDITDNIIRNNSVAFDAGAAYSGDGGGVYVFARGETADGACLEGNPTITVDGNAIDGNSAEFLGGGMVLFALSDGIGNSVSSTITNNLITGNQAGDPGNTYGDGGGLWGTTYGFGTETVLVDGNTVTDNAATLSGGGLSFRVDSLEDADHSVTISNNDVINNDAGGDGGGMQVWMRAVDLNPVSSLNLDVGPNTVTGNTAVGDNGGGGGVFAIFESVRSDVPATSFLVHDNTITGNASDNVGGGLGLWSSADAENFDTTDGQIITATARIDVLSNLIADNVAGTQAIVGFGGGTFLYLQSFGGEAAGSPSVATASLRFNTIADNVNEGGAGGVEIENNTGLDFGPAPVEGLAVVEIDNSIVSNNIDGSGLGFGIGGPPPNTAGLLQSVSSTFNLDASVTYSDVFGHDTNGNFQSSYPINPGTGTIEEDPLLDASFVPLECSPTIDAADPFTADVDASAEPAPNRGLPNMGHTGGTADAQTSLPDVNGDGVVDGIDVVRLAAAFGSSFGQARYDAAADMDGNDSIDGTDLAFVATSGYGDVCP